MINQEWGTYAQHLITKQVARAEIKFLKIHDTQYINVTQMMLGKQW